jgi:hypothetical protein
MHHENLFFHGKVSGLVNPERRRCQNKPGKIGKSFGINRTRVFMSCKLVNLFIIRDSSSREDSSKTLPGEFAGAATRSPW